jgi:hypothetical protein
MPALTRRRSPHAPDECRHVYLREGLTRAPLRPIDPSPTIDQAINGSLETSRLINAEIASTAGFLSSSGLCSVVRT